MQTPLPYSDPFVLMMQESTPTGHVLLHLKLSPGPLGVTTIARLTHAISQSAPKIVLLLESACATLPLLNPPEEQAWISAAGIYRQVQEAFKAQGGRIISVATQTLIGGTYLVHGMSAQHRLVYPNTQIYPGLSPSHYEAIFQKSYPHPATAAKALETGLITDIIRPGQLSAWLQQKLS